MISNLTNAELEALIMECEDKYRKLYKLASKLAVEMDSLSAQYNEAKAEINKRKA